MKKTAIKAALFAICLGGIQPVTADEVFAGSTERAAVQDSETSNSHAHADWAGLWIGVEGLFVFITVTEPGAYELEMMGETGEEGDNIRLPGRDAEGGITFERNGDTLLLHAATGEETGLKWLAEMKNCLMVQESEGFCRE